ncbi:hypothetical protein FSP39_000471 [Pinctada imbricata]|uniref:Tripartite motif-containing protein 2 n=1 Tax=Pinctada imbricata TaxID=66713 RepID=A0AA89C880_PINIB|nr:hypothetical protein FSP39_000471 [Pinctada imbricata]
MKWSRSVSIGNGHGTTQGVNVKILSTFECPSLSAVDESESDDDADDEPIHAIAPVTDNEAWIGSGWETTRIGLVERNGQNRRLVDVDSRIDDFALTPNNELLMSCFREKLIKRLSKDGDIVSEIHTPFFPRGITSCSDGGFIVCMTDDYSTSLASDSRRLLMKYSNEYELKDSYEIYEESRLFRRPYRVAENNNGDICVSDRTSMGSGRVIVLFSNGKLRFVYEGPSNNQCERKFAPAGIVCDHLGRILVADTNNHCVHILDQSGQFLGFLLKREDGLVSPHTLSFDRAGGLWIGDELGNIRVFQYTQRSVMS